MSTWSDNLTVNRKYARPEFLYIFNKIPRNSRPLLPGYTCYHDQHDVFDMLLQFRNLLLYLSEILLGIE
jgi:hypothetical protein